MRIRNVKGAPERVANHQLVVKNPEQHTGNWKELFGKDAPIYMEIGMGKGAFITTHAVNNPDKLFIGIEYMTNVLYKALDKVDQVEVDNLLLIRMSAADLLDVFEEDEIDRIYLNFSDPWPKEKHVKNRLTNKRLLDKYQVILKEEGKLIFKTDNDGLFDYSLGQIEDSQFRLDHYTRDLHNSEYIEGNVMTEYEVKWTAKGKNINMLEARNRKK